MTCKEVKSNDLFIIEFLKEARILKRQLQLIKNNANQISSEDLLKILSIIKFIEEEINGLKLNSGVRLSDDRE